MALKITPVATNGAQQNANLDEGRSAGGDRVARAKAIARGETYQEPQRESPADQLRSSRSIKMKTQVTPSEYLPQQTQPAPVPAAAAQAPIGDNPNPNEPAPVVSEVTKPLSPEYAAHLKRERALQVKEREIQAREDALPKPGAPQTEAATLIERMKADPLGLLLENGVTYDQLTQAVLRSMEGGGPALTKVEQDLRNELKSLKMDIEKQTKNMNDSQVQARDSALDQMQKQADQLIAADDAYQMIRETGSNKDVRELIKRTFDETGEVLDVKEALEEIENDLLAESLKVARIQKVQQGLSAPTQQQIQAAQPRGQIMRTLTNRDTAVAVPSRRERAIAAALGKKLA